MLLSPDLSLSSPTNNFHSQKIVAFVLYLYSLKDLNMLFKEQEKN